MSGLESPPSVRVVGGKGGIPLSPPLFLSIVYFAAIVVGTLLLRLPLAQEQPVGWFEAFFTAVSATTVTGLTVVPTGASYSAFGEAVIAALMQLGGIGLMIFAALILSSFGVGVGLQTQTAMQEELGRTSIANLKDIMRRVVLFVVTLEFIGAAILAFAFIPALGWTDGLWNAVFHSISATNNAGFDLTGS
ncbi:MAG: potassium transporter TrkG, partial [Pacificimonas sp.]